MTVSTKFAEAERPAPSTTEILRCAVPTRPRVGVITTLHEFVELPQEAGANCAAADGPKDTSAALSLLPARASLPVPASVSGICPELPPTMDRLATPLTLGRGRLCSAPTASTRP